MIKFIEKRKAIRKPTKDIVVLYHNDCTDGFSSAWVAWKKFGNRADYIGINPGTAPIDGLKNKEVYMLDLVYPVQYLKKLVADNKKFIAIDHHVSNQKSFVLIKDGLFDNNHSGAVLAWKYFYPETKIPKLLAHIEDMDLWKFKISGSKELIAYLDTINFDFKKWSEAVKSVEDKIKYQEYLNKGAFILKYQDGLIESIITNHAVSVNFLGYKAYAVNSPIFNSQIANALYKKLPPIGIVWAQEVDGGIHVSLRSDGTVDVSKIASKFNGGGGHKKSAGFYVKSCPKLPWKDANV
jgi:uncharacterized protein